MSTKTIIKTFYYIIKVICKNGKYTYYKIGESHTKRPTKLVDEYRQLRVNDAWHLLSEELPCNSTGKRLNDKLIHEKIEADGKLKRIDTATMKSLLGQNCSGCSEFFQVNGNMTDQEVIEYVKSIVASVKKKEYRVDVRANYSLQYNKDAHHQVNSDILMELFKVCPEIETALYDSSGNNLLLAGQFDFDFIASLVCFNNVYIWHDTNENKHKYSFAPINSRITYLDSLEDVINLELKFKTVIANTPYGTDGAIINDVVRADVDWDYFVSLLPIKDMKDAGLEACSYIDMTRLKPLAPHIFPDADILPHILVFTKAKNRSYSSMEELCASSYVVDKPFIKFMRANVVKSHYAFDNISMWTDKVEVESSFIYNLQRTMSQHTCGMDLLETTSVANSYNFDNIVIVSKTPGYKNTICTKAGNSNYKTIKFKTAQEKHNFVEFYKENRNFINRMIVNQFLGIRWDGACWPKVDWTRDDWTVEKILKAVANYSDEEVQAVLDSMDKEYYIGSNDAIEKAFGEYLNELD